MRESSGSPPLLRFQLRQLGFHFGDEYFQLSLTLLTGVGVYVAGVLLSVDPPGRVAPLIEMIIDLADASGARPAPAGQNGLKSGHTRRFALTVGTFPSRRLTALLRHYFADTAVDIVSGRALHIVGDVGIDVQRGGRRHMAQHGGESLHIHAVGQRQGRKSVPLWHNKDKSESHCIATG